MNSSREAKHLAFYLFWNVRPPGADRWGRPLFWCTRFELLAFRTRGWSCPEVFCGAGPGLSHSSGQICLLQETERHTSGVPEAAASAAMLTWRMQTCDL